MGFKNPNIRIKSRSYKVFHVYLGDWVSRNIICTAERHTRTFDFPKVCTKSDLAGFCIWLLSVYLRESIGFENHVTYLWNDLITLAFLNILSFYLWKININKLTNNNNKLNETAYYFLKGRHTPVAPLVLWVRVKIGYNSKEKELCWCSRWLQWNVALTKHFITLRIDKSPRDSQALKPPLDQQYYH